MGPEIGMLAAEELVMSVETCAVGVEIDILGAGAIICSFEAPQYAWSGGNWCARRWDLDLAVANCTYKAYCLLRFQPAINMIPSCYNTGML